METEHFSLIKEELRGAGFTTLVGGKWVLRTFLQNIQADIPTVHNSNN